ncbi:hypothetical protein B0H66DRAFT_340520 [Apodospora peruviana]|uniref:IPT/TIG domain-containing protein n=1 Tax=Apodospora peruviana TaxID=516989 RepID=A0AAE0HZC6_9PEZI|nr:hypothetical protein B0H66DRAFT_340520 [Apodospora peruviana]
MDSLSNDLGLDDEFFHNDASLLSNTPLDFYQTPDGYHAEDIKADNHSPPATYPVTYDDASPQSSGSSRNSFDSSRLDGSPASRKSSFTDGDMPMADGDVLAKQEWRMTNDAPGTIDPSRIENRQSSIGNMDLDRDQGSPMDKFDIFPPSQNGSSPSMGVKDSPPAFTFHQRDGSNLPNPFLSPSTNGLSMFPVPTVSPSALYHQDPSPKTRSMPTSFDFHGLPGVPQQAPPGWLSGARNNVALFQGNAPQVLGRTISPPMSSALNFWGAGPYNLEVKLPNPGKTKSRVETQIAIKLVLRPLPPGIRKLHLPQHTVGKPKYLAKSAAKPAEDMLELHTVLVCTSAMENSELQVKALARARRAALAWNPEVPAEDQLESEDTPLGPQEGGEVQICAGCITREKKRASRRKKIKPADEDDAWTKNESKRVILFNTQEIKDWEESKPEERHAGMNGVYVDTPMRITCYCRHHTEKKGFQVIFTVTNCRGEFVAQTLSPSFMITDDHKTQSPPAEGPQDSVAGPPKQLPEIPSLLPQKSSPGNLSRSVSPALDCAPSSKRRKPSGSGQIPSSLVMTPRESVSPRSSGPQMANLDMGAPPVSAFPQTPAALFQSDHSYPFGLSLPFGNGPPTPAANGMQSYMNTNPTPGFDNMSLPMYSAPASMHASRAPSPIGYSVAPNPAMVQQNSSQDMQPSYIDAPVINKIVPAEGPKAGSNEVTILGSGFTRSMDVMFGDIRATTTTFWAESCLVCLVPPSPTAGHVPVTIKAHKTGPDHVPLLYHYQGVDEVMLMRHAMKILVGGERDDSVVNRIMQNIINYASSNGMGNSATGEHSGGSSYGGNHRKNAMSIESQLLKVLELIDLCESPHRGRLDLEISTTGQTMMHLASSLGLARFVAGLLARGASPNVRDKGGYTPLHMASLNNHPDIVRRLIISGANPTLRTLSNLGSRDVARSPEVRHAIPASSQETTHDSGLLHRRAHSATSLRSIWPHELATRPTPSTEQAALQGDEETESSSWYSTSSAEESDDEDDGLVLEDISHIVRGPISSPDSRLKRHLQTPENPEAEAGPGSPSAAVAHLKDQFAAQFQHLQQTMALHLQNLPQIPYMSNMPPLTDYQQRLYAMMPPFADYQRLLSMVPTIGRPGSPSEKSTATAGKELDARRWWYMSSLMATLSSPPAPPPAYEALFPQGASPKDTKQASAALAAAEAQADQKCAALYGETVERDSSGDECKEEASMTTSGVAVSDEGRSGSDSEALPEVLQIGRKRGITKKQQEVLRRAHAKKLTGLSSDRNLWYIWLPLLIFIVSLMFYNSTWGRVFGHVWDSSDVGRCLSETAIKIARGEQWNEQQLGRVQELDEAGNVLAV